MMDVGKITPAIGAEISGVDFSWAISPDVRDAVYRAAMLPMIDFLRA